jgi:peptidoglycan/LPS O-acetylase OafA/YrhL
MDQKKRLLGIDLCRGIAAYAVVLVHSGDEAWGVPIDQQAISFRLLFYFAVPFFLASSFYFMTRKPKIASLSDFWKSRFERIVIPYLIWSGIYLFLRIIFFFKSNQPDRLNQLLQDPLSIVFCGGASFHLYFLPLLLAGSTLILAVSYFSDSRFKTKMLVFFCLVSIAIRELVGASGNGFKIGSSIAFQGVLDMLSLDVDAYPPIKLVLVYTFWVLSCLPYFLVAIILNRTLLKKGLSLLSFQSAMPILVAFFIVNAFGHLFLPETVKDLIMAYSLLLLGICISQRIGENNRIVSNLGICSFGIYLIHPILINFTKLFVSRVDIGLTQQVTVSSMLIFSLTSFLLSWIVVSLMLKSKWLAKYTLGV